MDTSRQEVAAALAVGHGIEPVTSREGTGESASRSRWGRTRLRETGIS